MIAHFATLMILLALGFVCNQLVDIWKSKNKFKK